MKEQPTTISYGVPDMATTSGHGLSIETILTGQVRYNAAYQMASRLSMVFNGEVEKYVQFVTMFRTTFDNVINDPSSLYNLLTKHVTGPAKAAIVPCVYSGDGVNHYEEAMTILKNHYDSQNGVINGHKKKFNGRKGNRRYYW